ncbi:MAG: hypothetical protein OEM52_01050 [bacterium]|nr:hypothetical protein [bacterium]
MATGEIIFGPRPMDPLLSAWPGERRNMTGEVTFPDPQPLDEPTGLVLLREELRKRLRPDVIPFLGAVIDLSA